MYRLSESVDCILAYVTSHNFEIALNDQRNPIILKPLSHLLKSLKMNLMQGMINSNESLWEIAIKPMINVQEESSAFLGIKSIVRKIDAKLLRNPIDEDEANNHGVQTVSMLFVSLG